jgi:hypothetical protein
VGKEGRVASVILTNTAVVIEITKSPPIVNMGPWSGGTLRIHKVSVIYTCIRIQTTIWPETIEVVSVWYTSHMERQVSTLPTSVKCFRSSGHPVNIPKPEKAWSVAYAHLFQWYCIRYSSPEERCRCLLFKKDFAELRSSILPPEIPREISCMQQTHPTVHRE